MTSRNDYEAPALNDLGSVHDMTLASVLKNKKLAFSIDYVSKKHNLPILFTKSVKR